MGTQLIELWGIPGIFLTALGIYIMYLHNTHKKERDEWKLMCDTNAKMLLEIIGKGNDHMEKVVGDNTSVLAAIKTLIESLDRRVKK